MGRNKLRTARSIKRDAWPSERKSERDLSGSVGDLGGAGYVRTSRHFYWLAENPHKNTNAMALARLASVMRSQDFKSALE